MTETLLIFVTAALLAVVCVWAFAWFRNRRIKRYSSSELEKENDHLRQQVDQFKAKLERTRELLVMHMEQNEKFEKQRNEAWRLYQRSGLQAGNAQQWLMRELQQKLSLLNQYRKKAGEPPMSIDPELSGIVQEFADTHAKEDHVMLAE